MNRRLSESRIRATCRELLAGQGRVSGRVLCAELRTRFGAVGKTERVFGIWREELAAKAERALSAGPALGWAVAGMAYLPANVAELERRVKMAEAAAAENLKRAELAEYREQAHQERWALEVDRLRQQVRAQEAGAAEVSRLQERVLQLSRELMALRP
jgi:hypothetical protein